jgi:hypothetical protein
MKLITDYVAPTPASEYAADILELRTATDDNPKVVAAFEFPIDSESDVPEAKQVQTGVRAVQKAASEADRTARVVKNKAGDSYSLDGNTATVLFKLVAKVPFKKEAEEAVEAPKPSAK